MLEVEVTTEIDRPAEVVFAYMADMANNTTWQKGMKECRWTSDPPLRVGSTYDQVAEFLGRRITSSFEVTELEPGRRIRIETRESSFPLDITRSVEPLDDNQRCRVKAEVRGAPGGLARVARPLMRIMVRRSIARDYQRLAEILEAR